MIKDQKICRLDENPIISKYQQALNMINELNKRSNQIKDLIFLAGKKHSDHLYAIIYRHEQFAKELRKNQDWLRICKKVSLV